MKIRGVTVRCWGEIGSQRGSWRTTVQLSIKGWFPVNYMKEVGRVFQIRVGFKKSGVGEWDRWVSVPCLGVGVCMKAFSYRIKEEVSSFKLPLWTDKSLPETIVGPHPRVGIIVLAHSYSIRQRRVETMEEIYGWENGRAVSSDLLRLIIKLFLGWQNTCPIDPCLSPPLATFSTSENGVKRRVGYSNSQMATCLHNPWECIREHRFSSL